MSRSRLTAFAVVLFDGKHMTWSNLMALVIFAQSLNVCEIYSQNNKNAKTLALKMKVTVKK